MANQEKPSSDPKPAKVAFNPDSDLPPDADIEEKFNDFWKKNAFGIFGGIALGAIVVVGVQLYDYMQLRKEADIQDTFKQAVSVEDKEAFVAAHEDHALASLARLHLADIAYEEGRFSAAADLYASARENLQSPALAGRAQLGQGVALLQIGEVEAGKALLQAVSSGPNYIDQLRGESAYHLAVQAWKDGDFNSAEAALDLVAGLENAQVWSFQAENLRNRIPELATLNAGQ